MKYMAEIITLFAQLPEDKKEIAIWKISEMMEAFEKTQQTPAAPDVDCVETKDA